MADIAKVLFKTINTPIGDVEIWGDNTQQVADAIAAGDKIRSIDYIYFRMAVIKASGKKPASFLTQTASEFKKQAVCVANPAMPASVYLSMTEPLLNAACLSDDEVIRETFAAVTKGLDEYEATKPAASSPLRKVEDYMTSTIANLFLIAAGTSGNIPETLDISKYLTKALAEAKDKAEKLGQDSNGQFRLKKAKDSTKPEASEPDSE